MDFMDEMDVPAVMDEMEWMDSLDPREHKDPPDPQAVPPRQQGRDLMTQPPSPLSTNEESLDGTLQQPPMLNWSISFNESTSHLPILDSSGHLRVQLQDTLLM